MIYFAYGADLNPAQLDARVPGYRPLGVARLTGHKLIFPRFAREWRGATASLAPSAGAAVFGALYDLPPEDIPVLHRHKGYDPESPPELNEHVFREVTVRRLANGESLSTWTYLAVPDNTTAPPSAAYVNAILDGARRHGLPRAYMLILQGIKTG